MISADFLARIQRHVGHLIDHLQAAEQLAAAMGAASGGSELGPEFDTCRFARQEPQMTRAERLLPLPEFADDRDRLARPQGEG